MFQQCSDFCLHHWCIQNARFFVHQQSINHVIRAQTCLEVKGHRNEPPSIVTYTHSIVHSRIESHITHTEIETLAASWRTSLPNRPIATRPLELRQGLTVCLNTHERNSYTLKWLNSSFVVQLQCVEQLRKYDEVVFIDGNGARIAAHGKFWMNGEDMWEWKNLKTQEYSQSKNLERK